MPTNENEPSTPTSDPSADNRIVRLIKSIVVNPERGKQLDDRIIKFKYYNSFNYSLIARDNDHVNMTLGITSARPGEGKTLVASNLAVSLALGSQKKTVIVDLNVAHPRLHQVFGTVQSPGLAEALTNGSIHISHTSVEHLSVLTTGNFLGQAEEVVQSASFSALSTRSILQPALGLDHLAAFRDVIYSLEQVYDFVIVDMPAMNSEDVPILFANQLNGIIVVVESGKTQQDDLDAIFRQINERHVIGFVFNRFNQ